MEIGLDASLALSKRPSLAFGTMKALSQNICYLILALNNEL